MWKQESIWVKRNEHDVIVEVSEHPPEEVKAKNDERWKAAIEHAELYLDLYKKEPMGVFGAMNISNAISRYEDGDRSERLLEELEQIQ